MPQFSNKHERTALMKYRQQNDITWTSRRQIYTRIAQQSTKYYILVAMEPVALRRALDKTPVHARPHKHRVIP